MKTRTLFVTALLGLGMMASCSNDELEGVDNGQNPDGKAYAQIAINVANSATTRAINGDTGSEEPGTPAENAVSKVTVVLADPASDIAQYVYNFSTTDENYKLLIGSETSDFATEPFEVPAGKYHVYVLANFGNNGLEISSINPGFDMKQEIGITKASSLSTANSFLMANGGVSGDKGDGYGEVFDCTETGTTSKEVDGDLADKDGGATLYKVAVNIERVVSKVTFNQTKTSFDVNDANNTKLATATVNGVSLINLNKKMYLIREAKKATHSPNGVTGDWFYPVDPNYNKLTSADELTANFSDPTASSFPTPSEATFYCPENTMTAEAQLNGQTTGVVYKITWALNTASGNNPYTELDKEGTDTYSQIFAAILKLDDSKDSDIDENIFKADLAQGTETGTFYAYNDLIFKNKNAAILYRCIATATGADNSAKATAANTAFTTAKSAALPDDIAEYTGGVNYYPVWIKHNPDGSNMQQDKFGVVRNHWYELTVTGISNLGNDKPTFENPDDPDDPAVANIQVAAKIKKWTVVKQNVEL